MRLENQIDSMLPEIVDGMARCWTCSIGANTERGINLAGQQAVHRVLDELISLLFPGCHGHEPMRENELKSFFKESMAKTAMELRQQARRAFEYQCRLEHCTNCDKCADKADHAITHLLKALPGTQQVLQRDIQAAYEGDPAAKSVMEVVMSYPGLHAVIVHRIAHLLYEKGVPLIPRIMSEHAHSRTGIDIHPGAAIGPGFFIDHGTGVVIGETCTIGENVKLYQGVTLGALSFEKDAQGRLVKGVKRHPDVGDNVVIYAGATILGGKTIIGAGSEIGGNVWLTHSVPPGSKVYNQQPRPLVRHKDGHWHVADGPWNDTGAGI
jgi:serine O-acetyltransferase